MKSGEALRLLGINRTRLMNYVKNGNIRAVKHGNRYDYNDEDVINLSKELRDSAYYMKQTKAQILKIFEKSKETDCNVVYVDAEDSSDNFSTMIEKALFEKSFRKITIDPNTEIPVDVDVLRSQLEHVGCELIF